MSVFLLPICFLLSTILCISKIETLVGCGQSAFHIYIDDSVDLIGFYQIANDLRQQLFRKLSKIGLNQQGY